MTGRDITRVGSFFGAIYDRLVTARRLRRALEDVTDVREGAETLDSLYGQYGDNPVLQAVFTPDILARTVRNTLRIYSFELCNSDEHRRDLPLDLMQLYETIRQNDRLEAVFRDEIAQPASPLFFAACDAILSFRGYADPFFENEDSNLGEPCRLLLLFTRHAGTAQVECAAAVSTADNDGGAVWDVYNLGISDFKRTFMQEVDVKLLCNNLSRGTGYGRSAPDWARSRATSLMLEFY